MKRDNFIYIDHILESVEKIFRYTNSVNVHHFVENEMLQDAVIRNFEIIGEATKGLTTEFREKYGNVPWKQMAGMRDILIHDYLGIDVIAVWDTIERDLPKLKKQLVQIQSERCKE